MGSRAGGGGEEPKLHSPLLPASATARGVEEGHGEVSGQLESILSDGSQPWARRMAAASVVETRLLVRLAAPAVLVYMINYLMSMSTQIFSGHLGTLELAAASLGNTGIQVFAYGLMVRNRRGIPAFNSILHLPFLVEIGVSQLGKSNNRSSSC
jgi:multidrug resistance protein, MATE family